MNSVPSASRRNFLIGLASTAAAGLTLELKSASVLAQVADDAVFTPNATSFITVNPNGTVTFRCAYVEMGQGVYTSLSSLIAEELDIDLAAFEVIQADIGDEYKLALDGTWRMTAGSSAIRWTGFMHRRFGATARAMLIKAAAGRWDIPTSEIETDNGRLWHRPSNRSLGYGEVANDAALLSVPRDVPLKSEGFRYIGKPTKRIDTLDKVTGRALYGIDVQVPDMVHAAVLHAPVYGAEADHIGNTTRSCVIAVERLPGAVAVIAEKWWTAKSALDALEITWTDHPNATYSSDRFLAQAEARLDEFGVPSIDEDDAETVAVALRQSYRQIERVYRVPFLSHGQIEPGTAVARWNGDHLELWVENQGPDHFMNDLAYAVGVTPDQVTFHTPLLGGAFGRRLHADLACEAARLARAVDRPVKVIWSREEDFKRDWYRPCHVAKLRAGLDSDGRLTAYHATTVGDGPGRWYFGFRDGQPRLDRSLTEGLQVQGYNVPLARVDYVFQEQPVQCGFWRSVGGSQNGFFRECFMDEVAEAAGIEPVEFRRRNYADRWRIILKGLTEMAGYREGTYTDADGSQRAMGTAVQRTFESIVGQIAEVSIRDGRARVHRVWCTFDIGSKIINPNITRQQIEGAIVMGLSAALYEEITFEHGLISAENFDRYNVARLSDAPEIKIAFIETPAEEPGGVGEPGVPPVAPAIVNALYKLTGERIRSLPLARTDL